MRQIDVRRTAHGELRDYLDRFGPEGLFARYVVSRTPDAHSLAAFADGVLRGVTVGGREHGHAEVFTYWLLCDDAEAAQALAGALLEPRASINYAPEYRDAIMAALPEKAHTFDYFYVASAEVTPSATACRLTSVELAAIEITEEMRELVGRVDDWTEDSHLYGIVEQGLLVCVAETNVRDSQHAAIQQVYTLTDARGRGLARDVVALAAAEARREGLLPVYHVTEQNRASIAVAERVGLTLHSRWGAGD